jgi:GT2 family glycosyltransferase
MMSDSNDKLPLVSIISLNFKDSSVTKDFLTSIAKISYPSYEVIIVDNASEYYPDELHDIVSNFNLVISEKNLGFAGGNNLGLAQAKGDFILFINNDVEVEASFLQPLVKRMLQQEDIAICCPKICYFDQKSLIQYAGYTDLKHFSMRNKTIGFQQRDNGDFDQSGVVAFPHGAAMLCRKKAIQEAGPMDSIFFLYYEEMDWGKRLRNHGYSIFYEAESRIFHKESLSTGKNSPLKAYYLNRNRFLYLRRHFKGLSFFLGYAYHVVIVFPKLFSSYLFQLKFKHAYSIVKALFWNFTHSAKTNT